MTQFETFHASAISIIHTALFYSKEEEYILTLQSISGQNLIDSSIVFPDNFIFSKNGAWEVVFDLASNAPNGTPFQAPAKGAVSALQVVKSVERMILDHYTEFKSGMYLFWPETEKLENIYKLLLRRLVGQGFTVEYGFEPYRRGYVLRTPRCY